MHCAKLFDYSESRLSVVGTVATLRIPSKPGVGILSGILPEVGSSTSGWRHEAHRARVSATDGAPAHDAKPGAMAARPGEESEARAPQVSDARAARPGIPIMIARLEIPEPTRGQKADLLRVEESPLAKSFSIFGIRS